MEYQEIYKCLSRNKITQKKFNGVLFYDQLKNVVPQKGFYILNCDISTSSGSHWTVLHITEKNIANELFDSFGREPSRHEILRFFAKNDEFLKYSKRQLQSTFTENCGYWCCVFIFCRALGHSFEEFLAFFNNDFLTNDMVVQNTFVKLFSTQQAFD